MLPKTKRPTRITLGDDGALGKRNVASVIFTVNDLKTPAAANNAGVIASQTASASADINLPVTPVKIDVPRAVRVVVGGTAASIKAAAITVYGKNAEGATISETFTPTVDTAGTLEGTKAFAEVNAITIPQQDGAGVTVSVGLGLAIGIGSRNLSTSNVKLYKRVIATGAESLVNAGSSTLSSSAVESNVITLDATPAGTAQYRVYVLNYNWHLDPTNGNPAYGA